MEPVSDSDKQAERTAFEQLQPLMTGGGRGGALLDRLFKPLFAAFTHGSREWRADALGAIESQRELRARGLLYTIAVICLLALLWSAFAAVDEVTRGEGKVIPSRQLQVVQSVDGGVVEEVLVREGERVEQGALLMRIDPTRFVANFQESSVRVFALGAKAQRLSALVDEQPYQPRHEQPLSAGQQAVVARERAFFDESLEELAQRRSIAREQHSQRQRELEEARARLRAAEEAHALSARELEVTRPLLRSGAVSEMDVLRLERELAAADGERRQAQARVRQVAAAVQEAEARIAEVAHSMRNQWRAELSETTAQLDSLGRSVAGLADRVKFAEIHSPVKGTIQRVLYNTIGGVVQPGHAVIEIVPADDRLLVEAKIAPKDIAFLRPGLPATIKLHAYDFSLYGGMSAELQHISPDTITDEQGNTFYLVRAMADDAEFVRRFAVIPGMTAQLDIMTGKKTVLAYLLKPLLRAKGNALSER